MSTNLRCVQCGNPVGEHAPAGLCAACLLKPGLGPSEASAQTAPFDRPQTAPTIAELAPFFPDLEIIKLLGQGGMGAVYQARQVRLDRIIALKILPKVPGHEEEFANRFAREARAMARLNHPNIVNIHDYGDKAGWCFFIMEYVDGVNLREAIRTKSVEPKEALGIVGQVCDALQYAHQEGVVHRDIKPENILLDKRGRVKIADFGLAKLLGGSTLSRGLTATNQVMGTVGYMAPEQMEGSREVDQRADIFSLGVVFYELLTGELPLGRFVPPSQKVQIDVRIDEVVLKTLEKEPDRRYQYASQIKQDVEQISRQLSNLAGPALPATQPTLTSTWSLQANWAGAALISLGLLEGLLFLLGMFQMQDLKIPNSTFNRNWIFLIMFDLFCGLSGVFAGYLLLRRKWWSMIFLGTVVVLVPLAPLCMLIQPQSQEAGLKQLIDLAERQGIKFNATEVERSAYSTEARILISRILSWSGSSHDNVDQLILLRWPTILVTLLSSLAGIWTLLLLCSSEGRQAFGRKRQTPITAPSTPSISQPVPPLVGHQLQLGFTALLAIITLCGGLGLLVWLGCAFLNRDPVRTLVSGYTTDEYTVVYSITGLLMVWAGIYLSGYAFRLINQHGQSLTNRIQFWVLAGIFAVATGYFVLLSNNDQQAMVLKSRNLLAYYSEPAGWIAALGTAALLALVLGCSPLSWSAIKRLLMIVGLLFVILIVLAFILLPSTIQVDRPPPSKPPIQQNQSMPMDGPGVPIK